MQDSAGAPAGRESVFGVWGLEFGVWSWEFGVWSLEFGVYWLGSGVWGGKN